jgi:hypothetical protein
VVFASWALPIWQLMLTSRVLRIDGLRGFDDRLQSRRLGDRDCLGDNSSSRLT